MRLILTTGWEDGLADLLHRLVKELAAGKQVLWLLSGGSNIQGSVEVMNNISPRLRSKLTVTLGDERYGKVGHINSNFAQLLKAGFKPGRAKLIPVLQEGLSFEATAVRFDQYLCKAFQTADTVIAQLGMGDDGHVSGILPHSPATETLTSLTTAYRAKPFDRMTLTFHGLEQISAAYVFAFGEPKRLALQTLHHRRLPLAEQPVQILKQLREAYVYNDQVGD